MSYMYRSDLACLTVCGGRGLTFHGSSCLGKLCSQSSLWCQFLSPASLACLLSYCFVSMDQGSLRKGVNTWEGSEVQKRLEFIRSRPDCSGNLEWVCVESSFGGGCAPPFFMQCLFLCLAFGYGRSRPCKGSGHWKRILSLVRCQNVCWQAGLKWVSVWCIVRADFHY